MCLYGTDDPHSATAVVSFTLIGKRVSEIGYRLDEEDEILCRVGLHCAPAAHRSIGTFPQGTVRLAAGPMLTPADIEKTISALARIAVS